jgi:hypothetical protein
MDESKGRGLGEPAGATLAIEWRVYNRLVPVLDANTLDVLSHGADQTQRLGSRLGELLQPGDVVCLAGDLGSGKTTLAQGIVRGWGALTAATSPTFVLVNEYPRRTARVCFISMHSDWRPGGARLRPRGAGCGGACSLNGRIACARSCRPTIWVDLRWAEDTARHSGEAVGGRTQLLDRFRRLTFDRTTILAIDRRPTCSAWRSATAKPCF